MSFLGFIALGLTLLALTGSTAPGNQAPDGETNTAIEAPALDGTVDGGPGLDSDPVQRNVVGSGRAETPSGQTVVRGVVEPRESVDEPPAADDALDDDVKGALGGFPSIPGAGDTAAGLGAGLLADQQADLGTRGSAWGSLTWRSISVFGGGILFLYSVMFLIFRAALKTISRQKNELSGANDELTRNNLALEIARDEAEEASRVKGQFLAHMSHEVRTPITGVMGMAGLALETDLNEEQRDYIETIQSSAESLLRIVNDVLDFSKLEAGKLELHAKTFDLEAPLKSALDMVAPIAYQKDIDLICDVSPDFPAALMGDPDRLQQVFLNLLGNAVKFTTDGHVLIKADVESTDDDRLTAIFSVEDSGIGIPKDTLSRIFDPFAQADSSFTRPFGGTGLGLTISAELVEMMDGRIWAESVLGHGSAFKFTAGFHLAGTAQPWSPPLALKDRRVLLLDHHKLSRLAISRALESAGAKVIEAQDSPRALRLLASDQGPIDIALLDTANDAAAAVAVAEAIRSRPDSDGVKPILLSRGHPNLSQSDRERLGASLMFRPLVHKQLLSDIAQLLVDESKALERYETPAMRILLVEERGGLSERFAVKILRKQGHIVDVAESEQAAVTALGSSGYDAVLLNVDSLNGANAGKSTRVSALRESAKGPVPVLALTTGPSRDVDPGLNGVDAYLSKPLSGADLREAVERVARRSTN